MFTQKVKMYSKFLYIIIVITVITITYYCLALHFNMSKII